VLTPLPYATVEVWSVSAWEIWIFVTAILWALLMIKEGGWRIAPNPLVLPMLGLLGVAVYQMLAPGAGGRPSLSYDPYLTFLSAVKLLALILFFVLFATFVDTDERRGLVVKLMLGMCLLIALIGVGQNFIGKALWQRGTFGPFVNRNHFAGYLEMGIGLGGAMIAARSIRLETLAFYACAVLVLVAGLVLSASRGGLVALGAEILFLAVFALTSRRHEEEARSRNLVRAAAIGGLGLATVLVAVLVVGSEGLVANFAQAQDTATQELLNNERFSRADIWRATAEMIRDHPFLGVGLGAYQIAYTRYDLSSGTQRVEQAHNDYLQIVADAGVLGGLLALVFIILLFRRGLASVATSDRRRRAIALGALTGCFAIAVHSLVDFNLQITANAQMFLALAALATAGRRRRTEHRRRRKEIAASDEEALAPAEMRSE
jgi:O-antigen ligase